MQNAINFQELGARLRSALHGTQSGLSEGIARTGMLVILDVHGVMVEKAGNKDKTRRQAAQRQRRQWRAYRNYSIWLRPHLSFFLHALSTRHEVAVWSSALYRNILPVLQGMDDEFGMTPSLQERLAFVWDREQCRMDGKNGKHCTVKRLDDVWCRTEFRDRYTSRNTLLLDDSPSKVRYFPHCSVIVPEYTAESLGDAYNKDDTLLWLLLYIEYLVTEATTSTKPPHHPTPLNLAASRSTCLPFKAFVLAGRLEANQQTHEQNLNKTQSLALVFLDDHHNADPSITSIAPPSRQDHTIAPEAPASQLAHSSPVTANITPLDRQYPPHVYKHHGIAAPPRQPTSAYAPRHLPLPRDDMLGRI